MSRSPLDASGTTDPDGNGLTFEWSIYPPAPEIAKGVMIRGGKTAKPESRSVQILRGRRSPSCSLLKTRTPSLTRYGRVLLRVEGRE